jgi:hypothetical protein
MRYHSDPVPISPVQPQGENRWNSSNRFRIFATSKFISYLKMDENRTSEIIHREKRQFGPIERAMKDLQQSQSNYLKRTIYWSFGSILREFGGEKINGCSRMMTKVRRLLAGVGCEDYLSRPTSS